jgi:hypothetical protein
MGGLLPIVEIFRVAESPRSGVTIFSRQGYPILPKFRTNRRSRHSTCVVAWWRAGCAGCVCASAHTSSTTKGWLVCWLVFAHACRCPPPISINTSWSWDVVHALAVCSIHPVVWLHSFGWSTVRGLLDLCALHAYARACRIDERENDEERV